MEIKTYDHLSRTGRKRAQQRDLLGMTRGEIRAAKKRAALPPSPFCPPVQTRQAENRQSTALRGTTEYVGYYPTKKTPTPLYKRPGPILRVSAPYSPRCQECAGPTCEPRLHGVTSRYLPATREDPEPTAIKHRDSETGRRLSHKEKIKARVDADHVRRASML